MEMEGEVRIRCSRNGLYRSLRLRWQRQRAKRVEAGPSKPKLKGKVFYGQERSSRESATTVCGENYYY